MGLENTHKHEERTRERSPEWYTVFSFLPRHLPTSHLFHAHLHSQLLRLGCFARRYRIFYCHLSLSALFPLIPLPHSLSLSFSALCLVHVARCPLKQHVHYTLLFKRKDRYMKGLEVISRAPGVQRILSLLINIAILLAREHRYHKFSFSTPEKNEDFFLCVA